QLVQSGFQYPALQLRARLSRGQHGFEFGARGRVLRADVEGAVLAGRADRTSALTSGAGASVSPPAPGQSQLAGRSRGDDMDEHAQPLQRVLVALDGSEISHGALLLAIEFSHQYKCE